MKLSKSFFQTALCGILLGLWCAASSQAQVTVYANDVRTLSWLTAYSSRYARIYTTDTNKTNGVTATTWSINSLSQNLPVYTGVQGVYSSTNFVYMTSSGMGSHIMGPWYNDAARTTAFVNLPVNQKAIARFPRTPSVPTTKVSVQGDLGYFVDGVSMFDSTDATSYSNSNAKDGDAPGTPNGVTGDGLWNRDAYMNEAITFDVALSHQQNTGVYHAHANPIATRYLLGDHVDQNATTKAYSESTNATLHHSPIVGWIKDGFPLYGPYGYSNATNSASGIRRMVSGYVPRNGSYGTSNLTSTGRATLPAWAARAYNKSATLTSGQYGPAVSTSFPFGRYLEDNDFLGDHGYTQGVDYDLDEYNGRYCVTPEFPNGTYAYFVAITTNGLPAFPYNVGRRYYGNPTGGTISNITETVVTNFLGGTNLQQTLGKPSRSANTIVLTWSGVEGGTYRAEAVTNLASTNWIPVATNTVGSTGAGTASETFSTNALRAYRVVRTTVASYDGGGTSTNTGGSGGLVAPGGSVSRGTGTNVTITITLPTGGSNPPSTPPANAPITSVTLGGITGTSVTGTTSGIVIASFNITTGNSTTGAKDIVVTFSIPPGQSSAPVFTLTGGFTINP